MENLPSTPGLARRNAYGDYIRRKFLYRNTDHFLVEPATIFYTIPEEHNNRSFNGLISLDILENSKIISNKKNFDLCSICLQVNNLRPIRVLYCSHSFHAICVDTWFLNNDTCPFCRKSLRNHREQAL